MEKIHLRTVRLTIDLHLLGDCWRCDVLERLNFNIIMFWEGCVPEVGMKMFDVLLGRLCKIPYHVMC
jgi:hypothetical protein